ncbi:MAG: Mrp/NBP35 family ATP-binding protein [Thermoanaerobaculia bacterium]|nr:Mrp/NBP35 family ATP-binding protein [Thermoanaerobaculia bacterium]
MSQQLEAQVWEALKSVKFPGMSRDVVSFGFVRGVEIAGGRVTVRIEMTTRDAAAAEAVRADAERAIAPLAGVTAVTVEAVAVTPPTREEAAQKAIARDPRLVPEVRSIVAVASGKGGVGKSTVAVNLALALARAGQRTGLLDVDIYGPSVPTMFGIRDRPTVIDNRIQAFQRWGVKVMSLGFILETDTPVIWRGPMVMRAIEQMLGDVDWGELDVLVLDMPPGTGDAQLAIAQDLPVDGAVIVSTPQDLALDDARKAIGMFEQTHIPILGIVENMSSFICPHCGENSDIFGHGGAKDEAERLGVAFLGEIPLHPQLRTSSDEGHPAALGDSPVARAFRKAGKAALEAADQASKPAPKIIFG